MKSEISITEKEIEKIKHSFLANISHEIRTPMNVIVGFSNLLSDPSYNTEQKQFFIEEINRNSRELLRLIDNIILTAKYENEPIELNLKEISVGALFDEIQQLISEKKQFGNQPKKKVILLPSNTPNKEVEIFTDPEILKKVMVNLVENAIKMFEEDHTVHYGYCRTEQKIEFFVQNTHYGDQKGPCKHKFQESNRFENKKREITTDFGSGLSVTDKLIQSLGGKLKIIYSLDKALSFNFTLPNCMKGFSQNHSDPANK